MTVGVVLMAYGTPSSLDEVEAYYTHIRRGRPPTEELLADLLSRYEAIGGISPLTARCEAQRDQLQAFLDEQRGAGRFRVELGYKHVHPFIEDTVAELASGRMGHIEQFVGIVLAPHHSRSSVGQYLQRMEESAAEHGVPASGIEHWHHLDEWLDFQTTAVRGALDELRDATNVKVVFTAHSLPVTALVGDRYEDQLRTSATEIARRSGLAQWTGWSTAWQSAGRTGVAWQGPDIAEVIDDLAGTGRSTGIVVCPQGFTADHLEVLFDLDILAREHAERQGLAFARTASVNDDAGVFRGLARLVGAQAELTASADPAPSGSVPASPRSGPASAGPGLSPSGPAGG